MRKVMRSGRMWLQTALDRLQNESKIAKKKIKL